MCSRPLHLFYFFHGVRDTSKADALRRTSAQAISARRSVVQTDDATGRYRAHAVHNCSFLQDDNDTRFIVMTSTCDVNM